LSAELTKTHSFRLFFGDFTHWVNVVATDKQCLDS